MLYVDFKDIIDTAYESILFGLIMGIYSVLLNAVIHSIGNVILLPKKIYEASNSISSILKLKELNTVCGASKSRIKELFFDFLYVLSYGVFFILFLYMATDGVFRLHIALISFGMTYLFSVFLGRRIKFIILKLINGIYLLITIIFSFVVLPIRKILKGIKALIMRFLKKIRSANKNHVVINFFSKRKNCAK